MLNDTTAINFLSLIYNYISDLITFILENTLFTANPEIATRFGDVLTLLITLSTFFILLEFVNSAKKIIKLLLILGWILVVISIIIEYL